MPTSAELVVGAVAIEVVTLAVFSAVDLSGVVSLLAFAGSAHAVAVVAADVGAVVLAAVGVQILRPNLVRAALALTSDATIVTPDENRGNAA